jgi:hypothetical protein
VLPDGRVGFIDFGIVGRISPVTWRAVEALLGATGTGDFPTMARALATIGATGEDVDIPVRRRRRPACPSPFKGAAWKCSTPHTGRAHCFCGRAAATTLSSPPPTCLSPRPAP